MSKAVTILAIDPGPTESAYVIYKERKVLDHGIAGNGYVRQVVRDWAECSDAVQMVIEEVTCYGMTVGRPVFRTCVESGRFIEVWEYNSYCNNWCWLTSPEVKLHLCNTSRAKDKNVAQAVVDRYGGDRRTAVGTKKNPGPLYGIKTHLWRALALAIVWDETHKGANDNG